MTQQDKFQALLDQHGIRYFSAREAFFRGGTDDRLKINIDPPEALWPNLIPTLKVLDEARANVGPLILTSVYRNPAYNKAVGGASASLHMQFRACDVHPLRCTVARLHSELRRLRALGRFKGGIGKYATFIHIDTRGYNADF